MTWADRYSEGQRVQVWAEMTALGAQVRADDEFVADARAVVEQTMQRVRANVEFLVRELPTVGYVFEDPDELPPHEAPDNDIATQVDAVEREIGPIPMSLRGWYEHVGRVSFVGRFTDVAFEFLDPLVVDAPPAFVIDEHRQWSDDRGTEWDQGPFSIGFAPDWLHKANVSGGPPYSVQAPDPGVDTLVLWEPHTTTFVNYLRIAFAWAGFPGLDRTHEGWPDTPKEIPGQIAELRHGLVPI